MLHGDTVVDVISDLIEAGPSETFNSVYDPEADEEEFRCDPRPSCNADLEEPFEHRKEVIEFWKSGVSAKFGKKSTPVTKSLSTVNAKYRGVKDLTKLYRLVCCPNTYN